MVLRVEALRQRMLGLKDFTSGSAPTPSETLAIMGLRAAGQISRRSRELLRANLSYLRAFMSEHAALFSWSVKAQTPDLGIMVWEREHLI